MTYYENTNPLQKGYTRFVVEYGFYKARFKTDVDEINIHTAKAWFQKYYPAAHFYSIKKKEVKK